MLLEYVELNQGPCRGWVWSGSSGAPTVFPWAMFVGWIRYGRNLAFRALHCSPTRPPVCWDGGFSLPTLKKVRPKTSHLLVLHHPGLYSNHGMYSAGTRILPCTPNLSSQLHQPLLLQIINNNLDRLLNRYLIRLNSDLGVLGRLVWG